MAEPVEDPSLSEDLDRSLDRIRQKLAQTPQDPSIYNALGIVLGAKGRLDDGLRAFDRAVELCPTYGEAHLNMGLALELLGRDDEALRAFTAAAQLVPDFRDAEGKVAELARRLGQRNPRSRWQQTLLRRMTRRLRRSSPPRAQTAGDEAGLREALNRDVSDTAAASHLGRLLNWHGRIIEAEHFYRYALRCDPRCEDAAVALAELLDRQSKVTEAVDVLSTFDPDRVRDPRLFPLLLRLKSALCDWHGLSELKEKALEDVRRAPDSLAPLAALWLWDDQALHLACAEAFAAKVTRGVEPMAPRRGKSRPDKLTIGYVSADFHQHAVATLVAEMFELHDRSRFHIRAYALWADDGSELRRRIAARSDHMTSLWGISSQTCAEMLRADGVDVLIDLSGYTHNSNVGIFARRPAPVQINYLGYPSTTGATFFDYIMVDGFIAPAGDDRWYSEKLIRLPWSYQINDRKRIRPAPPPRSAYGLPEDALVLCCFNGNKKITPEIFDIWMRLLNALPNSVLWLRRWTPQADENLSRAAAQRGVNSERLIFADRSDYITHLSRYAVADLALDTLPFTAHTTASDALWMACPLITCTGASYASRVAGSLLTAAGVPELVTSSLTDYEALAKKLATDRGALRGFRERLDYSRTTSRVFDLEAVTRQLEWSYEHAWNIHASGSAPRSFEVPERS